MQYQTYGIRKAEHTRQQTGELAVENLLKNVMPCTVEGESVSEVEGARAVAVTVGVRAEAAGLSGGGA